MGRPKKVKALIKAYCIKCGDFVGMTTQEKIQSSKNPCYCDYCKKVVKQFGEDIDARHKG